MARLLRFTVAVAPVLGRFLSTSNKTEFDSDALALIAGSQVIVNETEAPMPDIVPPTPTVTEEPKCVDADGNPQPCRGTCPEGFNQMVDIEGQRITIEQNCTDTLARGRSFMLQGVKNADVYVPDDGNQNKMPWDPAVGCCYRIVWPQCPTGWTQAKGQYGARINDAETCFFNILNGRQFILGGTPNSYVMRLQPFETYGTCCYKVFVGDEDEKEDTGGCAQPFGVPTPFPVTENMCSLISADRKGEMERMSPPGEGYADWRVDPDMETGGECCVYKIPAGETGPRGALDDATVDTTDVTEAAAEATTLVPEDAAEDATTEDATTAAPEAQE